MCRRGDGYLLFEAGHRTINTALYRYRYGRTKILIRRIQDSNAIRCQEAAIMFSSTRVPGTGYTVSSVDYGNSMILLLINRSTTSFSFGWLTIFVNKIVGPVGYKGKT